MLVLGTVSFPSFHFAQDNSLKYLLCTTVVRLTLKFRETKNRQTQIKIRPYPFSTGKPKEQAENFLRQNARQAEDFPCIRGEQGES